MSVHEEIQGSIVQHEGKALVSASEQDLELIQRCLRQDKHAWEDFVDRYLRMVIHVANHTLRSRGIVLSDMDREDLVAEVFLEICRNDLACLKRFRGESTFSSYLTVVARRVIVAQLIKRRNLETTAPDPAPWSVIPVADPQQEDVSDDLQELLSRLDETESQLIQLHHLEGLSYREISQKLGVSENSVGPALSRARAKLRASAEASTNRKAA